MNVRNCRKCGKIFNYVVGAPVCPACKEALETKFQEVKKYVQEHRGATIPEVAEQCDVETSQIQQWIREERLEFASDGVMGISCARCGAAIASGVYCAKCKTEMANGFKAAMGGGAQQAPQNKPAADRTAGPRMRFM